MPVELSILVAFLLVLLNGFFVAAEFALVKVRATQIEQLAQTGNRYAVMARHAVHHLDAYLSATQLGITLASIGLGWIGEPAFAVLLDPLFQAMDIPEGVAHGIAFGVAFLTITVLHVVLGELAPKSWAIQRSDRIALAVSFPLHWFYVLFLPLISVLNGLANRLLRVFGIRPAGEHESAHSQEELSMILAASGQTGVLTKSEVDLMEHVFRFADKNAEDIMTPRVDVAFVRREWSVSEALEAALAQPFSRYPVVKGDIDEIVGVVHVRELVKMNRGGETVLEGAMRPVIVVPVSKRLDALLAEFQRARTHLAVVADEYGGTAGIVTLEDVVEQIVGSISDETDLDVVGIESAGDGFVVLGKMRLDEINEVLTSKFESEDFDTLSGYVSGLLGKRGQVGDTAEAEGWRFEVLEADELRIRKVRLSRQDEPGAKSDPDPDPE